MVASPFLLTLETSQDPFGHLHGQDIQVYRLGARVSGRVRGVLRCRLRRGRSCCVRTMRHHGLARHGLDHRGDERESPQRRTWRLAASDQSADWGNHPRSHQGTRRTILLQGHLQCHGLLWQPGGPGLGPLGDHDGRALLSPHRRFGWEHEIAAHRAQPLPIRARNGLPRHPTSGRDDPEQKREVRRDQTRCRFSWRVRLAKGLGRQPTQGPPKGPLEEPHRASPFHPNPFCVTLARAEAHRILPSRTLASWRASHHQKRALVLPSCNPPSPRPGL